MNTIGERIYDLMKENGYNQRQLADKIGVAEAVISRYVNNEREPRIAIIEKLVVVLNTTADYLITGRKEKFENIETLKLLTCASICYAKIKHEMENRMRDSKDIADLYFNIPTVQYTTFDFALSALATSELDCNKISGFGEILNAMPNFKSYLEKLKNKGE